MTEHPDLTPTFAAAATVDRPAAGSAFDPTVAAPPLGSTLAQTVGPYLHIGLLWPDGPEVVPVGTPGAIRIGGQIFDGAGAVVPDALVETWQADPDGRFDHPDDPRGARPPAVPGFGGFGRSATDADGRYEIRTVRPGALPGPDGDTEAPHLNLSIFARGLLHRLVTRLYFPDEEAANAADPVLGSIDPARRTTLTLAMLATLQQDEELAMHVRAASRNGLTREEVREVLLQVSVYAGVPAANRAFKVAQQTLRQEDG